MNTEMTGGREQPCLWNIKSTEDKENTGWLSSMSDTRRHFWNQGLGKNGRKEQKERTRKDTDVECGVGSYTDGSLTKVILRFDVLRC